jgi:acyl carrier protein
MQTTLVEESIRRFVFQRFPIAQTKELGNDDSLLEKGILDSLGVLEIVGFLEQEFQITVNDEDLAPENFASISSMAAYVTRIKHGIPH